MTEKNEKTITLTTALLLTDNMTPDAEGSVHTVDAQLADQLIAQGNAVEGGKRADGEKSVGEARGEHNDRVRAEQAARHEVRQQADQAQQHITNQVRTAEVGQKDAGGAPSNKADKPAARKKD
jgi:hypothetical protein